MCGSQNVAAGPVTTKSSGYLLEMQILRSHPKSTE